ncbi:MAG: hypothetical protein KJI72_03780 [Patescibacteria group bacterium]|nr:hypothetical protein [Patescibacteria group bacterium]
MKLSFKFFSGLFKSASSKLGKRYIFLVIAVVMLVIVGGFVVYSLNFLVSSFNEILISQLASPPILRFDIQGFEELNLIR